MWCWLNGSVSLDQITRELHEMKDKGMGGADMWDVYAGWASTDADKAYVPVGPEFMGAESVAAIGHAMKEANELGLQLGLFVSSGWNAGGKWVEPKDAIKALVASETRVEGPGHVSVQLPFPENKAPKDSNGMPLFHREVATLAVPYSEEKVLQDTAAVVDLTDRLKPDGTLEWDAPAGEWSILRFACTNTGQSLIVPSPNSGGLMIDFLDRQATLDHFQYFVDKLIPFAKDGSFRNTGLRYLHTDSMEMGRPDLWTDNMSSAFEAAHGYDVTPYIPCLMGWKTADPEVSERFLHDFRKFRSDLLIDSHYVASSELLSRYGLEHQSEAGGPGPPIHNLEVDALKALGAVHAPMGEFWIKHRNIFLVKEIASAAHIYGKSVVDAESFTSGERWVNGPFDYKKIVDRAFCEGLTRVTYHTFDHSPPEAGKPGWNYHWGSDIDTNTAWWSSSRPFHDYIARCSYMLSRGLFVADVGYYLGDQVPSFYPQHHNVPEKIVPPGLGRGYDYDVVNSQVILERMDVRDGNIVLPDGMTYRLLVLPEQDHMPLEVLKKLARMVRKGAVVIGPKPSTVPGLVEHREKTRELKKLAAEVWGDCDGEAVKEHRYGKGKVLWGIPERAVLESMGVAPDFSWDLKKGFAALDYIHRRTLEENIYFVRNMRDHFTETDCRFRIKGRRPELWRPDSGTVTDCPVFEETPAGTRVPLRLAPGDSVCVVFREPPTGSQIVSVSGVDDLDVTQGPLYHASVADGVMWLSGGGGEQSLVFDLGAVRDLRRVRVWNYNEAGPGQCDRGVKDMEVHVSSDNDGFEKAGSITLKRAGGERDRDFSESHDLRAAGVRYVKFTILSNHAADGQGQVGLSEVKFYGEAEIGGVTVESVSSELVRANFTSYFDRAADHLVDGSGLKPSSLAFYSPPPLECVPERGSAEVSMLVAKPGVYSLRTSTGAVQRVEATTLPDVIDVGGPWQVRFPEGWGAPEEKRFDELVSWTDVEEEGVKHFSGTAVYEKDIAVPAECLEKADRMVLALGRVGCVADVSVNGARVGTLWKPPYAIDVRPHLKTGANALSIRVTNTWSNRMLGDRLLPEEERYCRSNLSDLHRYRWNSMRMVESGLMGPVRIHPVVKFQMETRVE